MAFDELAHGSQQLEWYFSPQAHHGFVFQPIAGGCLAGAPIAAAGLALPSRSLPRYAHRLQSPADGP